LKDLRTLVWEITENGAPDTHPKLIEELKEEYAHTIEIVVPPAPIHRFTCAVHAFGLIGNQDYEGIVMAAPKHVFAGTGFVQRLIDSGTLEPLTKPQNGDLVVYRSAGDIKHIGRMLSPDRVESKWGIGHLYRHALLEVPANYGDAFELFKGVDVNTVLDAFVEFARENGVKFEGD